MLLIVFFLYAQFSLNSIIYRIFDYNICMLKRYIPYVHAKSIYDVNVNYFLKENIKVLLLDLDNTLDSYLTKEPTEKAIELKNKLQRANIRLFIVSNNTGKRVRRYANALGIEYRNSIGKPFAFGLNRLIKDYGFNKDEVMLVGDQLITDIAAGNRAKIKTMYTDKVVDEDQITTRFNRIFEKPKRRRLFKKGLIKEWED